MDSKGWEALRDLDEQLLFHQHELAKHRNSGDTEKAREVALEILTLRKKIEEMVRGHRHK